ncbi:MAG: hypothetical protein ACF788_00875 [Novipirellula sp. JB048]
MRTIAHEWLESSHDVSWLVCEPSQRWADAARRFAGEGLAEPWAAVVIPCEAETISNRVAHSHGKPAGARCPPVIVLWELSPRSIAAKCRIITQIRWAFPGVIQLAGLTQIPRSLHPAISELGITLALRHPESLQHVAARINRRCFLPPSRGG